MAFKALFSIIPCVKRKEEKEEKEERKRSFLENGSILLEDLIASCDGKSHPIHCYSAAELIRATNNFDPSCIIDDVFHYGKYMYKGILDDRTVIVKKYTKWLDGAIRDIIISMQMSTHKNSLKLLGCCLEFDVPALVFENAGKGGLNSDGSLKVDNELLPWKTRLRIAKQLASALTYLHTAFPRPIVHRNIAPYNILLDDDYVPKLVDYSLSITIPPKQLYVEDEVKGTFGYLDPNYLMTHKISEKTDVYGLGVLLLVFLTGHKALMRDQLEGHQVKSVVQYARSHAFEDQFRTVVDPKILEEVGEGEHAQQQLHDFLTMALLCTEDESELRPDMIDVAKKLVEIEKSMFPR